MKRIILPLVALLISYFSFSQVCSKAQLPANLQNGLVAFYPFCGNANDESGNGNNGTVNGATLTTDRFGNLNSAYSFSGNTISVPYKSYLSFSDNKKFSVSIWVYTGVNNITTHYIGMRQPGSQTQFWQLYTPVTSTVKGIAFQSFTNGNILGASSQNQQIPLNLWSNLVGTYDNGVWKLYLNGILIQSSTSTLAFNNDINTPLTIGNSGNFEPFNGRLDDVRIYNRALTECEVQQLFNETSGSTSTPNGFSYNFLPMQKSVCETSTTIDAGSGFVSYLWSTGATSQTITATSSGEYRVTVANNLGCVASDTINVNITKADIIQNNSTICKGSSITLSVDSAFVAQNLNSINLLPSNLKAGLKAYYPFSGNANDVSGNNINGTVTGATLTTDRFGNANSAYSFNGSSFIDLGNISGVGYSTSQDITMSFWINEGASGTVISKYTNLDAPNSNFFFAKATSSAQVAGNGTNSFTANNITDYRWTNYVFVASAGTNKSFIYRNGILVATGSLNANGSLSATKIMLGKLMGSPSNFYTGKIDDVFIYNRVLTVAEIAQLSNFQPKVTWSTGATTNTISVTPTATTKYFATVSDGINSCMDSVTITVADFGVFDPLPSRKSLCGASLTLDAGSGFASYLWSTGATSQTISATNSGEHIVTVTNALGCSASDTIILSIVKADILQSDQTICALSPLTLSINSFNSSNKKIIDFDNLGLSALDITGGTASLISGVSGNGLSISSPTQVKTKDQTYGYGDYEVDAKTGSGIANQYLAILLPSNSWTSEAISIDSRTAGTDDVGWGVYVNGVRVAFANGTHPANSSSWYKMKIRVTPDSVKCWINSTLLYEGLNTTVPRNIGAVKLTTFDRSLFDNLIYTPYQAFTSVLWSNAATTSSISINPATTTTYYATISDGIYTCTDSVKITAANIVGFTPLQDTIKLCGDSLVLDAGAGFASYNWSNGATTSAITAKSSGRYIATVTNSSGCSASDTSFVSIVKAKILQRDTTICLGNSITLAIDSSGLNKSSACLKSNLPIQLQNGLIAYYPFCGNANDGSGNGINGILFGTPTLVADRFGNSNSAYNFNGSNQYIQTASISEPITNKTISAWVKLSNLSQMGGGLAAVQSSNGSIFDAVVYNETNSGWGFGSDNLTRTKWSGVKEAATEWVMLTATYENNSYKLYRNGVLISSTTQFPITSFGITSKFNIGLRHNNGGTPYLNGVIDDVYFYNKALSSSEILSLYNATAVSWSTGVNTNSITVSPITTTKYFVSVSDGITTCNDSIIVTVSDIGTFNPLQDTVKVCGDSIVLDAGPGYSTYTWSNGATTRTITAKASGKYFVNVANASGCTASDTSLVSIVKAKILQRDTTICKGSSITLAIDSTKSGQTLCSGLQLSTALKNGLVGYFPFCGNANDASGNGNNGNVTGATLTTDRFGNLNSAYNFSGNNQYISVLASNLPRTTRTTSLWFKTTNPSFRGILFGYGGDGNCGSSYFAGTNHRGTGKLMVTGHCIYNETSVTYAPPASEWVHFVTTSSSNGTNIYINGKLLATSNKQFNTIGSKLFIGANVAFDGSSLLQSPYTDNNSGDFWLGGIDDVMIYNRELTNVEVLELYTKQNTITWSTGASSKSIAVSPTTTTKYFVTVSDGITTCKDSITVRVSDIGIFNPLQDTVKVCGDSSVLDAGAGYATYNWSNGAITRTITAKASGKYFVNVANVSGCSASDTSIISIVKANIIQTDTTICKGSAINLSIDSAFAGNAACYKTDLPKSLQNGIVAYFPFCGNANDVSGNGNNGNVNGARLTRDRFNNDLSAYSFSSISDNSITGNLSTPLGQTFSISFWAKRNTNNIPGSSIQSDKEWMFSSGNSSVGGATNIGITNNSRSLRYGPWGTDGNDATYLVDNSWQHIVQTYSNGQFKIYVNGTLYKTSTDLVNLQTGAFSIGCQLTPFLQQGFDGSIDDVLIYSRELSNTEISLLFNTASQPSIIWSTGATTPSITVNPTVKTTYTVTVTDGINTCTDSVVVDVSSSELKVTDPSAVCSPGVVNLTAAAITSGSATGLTYTYWKDANATQALANPDKVSVSGTYYIVGTSSTGCTSAPAAVKVTVNPLPVATIIAPTQTAICDKSSITLTARGGTSYQWLLNGSAIAGAIDSTYAASQAGSYEVNVVALGCTSKVAAPVNLTLIKAAVPKFSNSSTCIDVPVSFFNETDTTLSGSVNWLWDFGDGQTSTLLNPIYTYKKSGGFIVKLTVTPKICSSLPVSFTKNITVDIPPVGIKYPNVLAVKNKATPLSARFIANGYTYLWMPSTGLNNAAIQKPVFNFSLEQLYRVRLTSAGGCITMDTVKVSVYDSSDIFVPKAFTPNKDGKNDLLQPFLVNITTLKFFRVYNRWGQLMFQSSDSKQGWDGMYNYKPQPLETYTWIAEGIDGNGTTIFRKGQTVLIR